MNLNIDDILIEIKNINWFLNCGKKDIEPQNFNFIYIDNIENAIKKEESLLWENYLLNENNIMSAVMSEFYPNYKWNELALFLHETFDKNIKDTILSSMFQYKIPNLFYVNVRYIVCSAIREHMFYNDKIKNDSDCSFIDILSIYKKGHLPCGWTEKNKSLFVY